MPSPGERIDLPSGDALFYEDADHSYWRCKEDGARGRRLTGVTTVTKTIDYDPGRLLNWSAKTQCIGVAELVASMLPDCRREDLKWLTSQETIWAALESSELTFEHVRDRAAKKGSNIHEIVFQALGMGRPVPDLDALTDEERMQAQGVIAFWLEESPEADQVEQIVLSDRLGVAGRLDFRGRIQSRDGTGIIDLKTGRFISDSAHSQVGGGYPLLSEESGFGDCEWALILQVHDDGSYDLIEAQGSREGFESAVATYREAGRIRNGAKKERERAEVRRKLEAEIEASVAA